MGQPYVAADHAVVADLRITAEDRGVGVDDHVAADIRVTLDALDRIAVFIELEAFGAQRDALVKLDMVADGGRLTDDDARAVVDEKVIADLRAGVDVDARDLVGVLGHHPRQHRHLHAVEDVGHAVDADRLKGGIGKHDLHRAPGGGIPVVGRVKIGRQSRLDLGELLHELPHQLPDILRAELMQHELL